MNTKDRLLALVLLTIMAPRADATVPQEISVQGVLRNGAGALQTTPVTVIVTFYDAVTAGNKLAGPYTASNVQATNGLFTVSIKDTGLGPALAASGTGAAFVEISVGNDTFARQPVTSEVFALQ